MLRTRVIGLVLSSLAASLHAAAGEGGPPAVATDSQVAAPARVPELWRPIGPGGGFALRAVVDPLVPARLFAIWTAGERREVYRRDPETGTWSFANRGLEGGRPDALALHPARPGTLWAATLQPLAVYRSIDAGTTWQRRFVGPFDDRPFGLWSLRRGGDAVLFGWFGETVPEAKIRRSTNGGQRWTESDGVRGPLAIVDGTTTAFALDAERDGLVRSDDAGVTWRASGALPVDADEDLVLAFLALPGRRPVLFLSFAQAGLYRSADRGATWTPVGPAGPGPSSLVASPHGLFGAFPDGLHVSTDRGLTWRPRQAAGFPERFVTLVAEPASATLYGLAQERSEIAQSRDAGRTWKRVAPRGVQQFVAEDFAWHPRDPRVQALLRGNVPMFGTAVKLLTSGDGGATWRASPFRSFAFDPTDPRVVYGGSAAGVSATHDGGVTWGPVRGSPTTTLAHSGTALFAGGCGIVRSENDGLDWTEALPCNAPPAPHLPSGGLLLPQRLLAHPTDPDVVWAEVFESFTVNGRPEGRAVLYGTFDGGATWERRQELGPRITLSPGRPDTLWDVGGFVIRRSDDRGLTWRRILTSGELHDLAVDPLDPDRIVAVGTEALISRDDGRTWSRAFDSGELAPWGMNRLFLGRVFLHPTRPGEIAVAPGAGGLLLRRAPLP